MHRLGAVLKDLAKQVTTPHRVIDLLRDRTRDAHERIEARVAAESIVTERELGAFLLGLWQWHAGHEEALWARSEWPSEVEPVARAVKVDWLRDDLDRLGISAVARTFEPRMQLKDARYPELLGTAYVVEGSMLGGQVLHRLFADRLGFESRYFAGYGRDTGPRWRRLLSTLSVFDGDPLQAERIADGACLTFASMEASFESQGALD